MMRASPAVRPGGSDGRAGLPQPGGRYGLLLLVLISTYLLSSFSISVAADLQVPLFLAALLLALRRSPLSRRWTMLVGAVALVGSVAAFGASLTDTNTGDGVSELWKGLVLLLTAVLIVRRVLARPTVTLQSIYGALSAYIIIGLMFATFYAAIEHLGAGNFFADGHRANTQTFQYFSFTTLTTLGYGDFTAAGNGGRALAVMEALTGQVFLATLVARLVAAFRATPEQALPASRPRWPPSSVRHRTSTSYRRKPAGDVRRAAPPRTRQNTVRTSSDLHADDLGATTGRDPAAPQK
ncbi:MAG: potassium channel family protein [Streptosporangiaceae bacterium]